MEQPSADFSSPRGALDRAAGPPAAGSARCSSPLPWRWPPRWPPSRETPSTTSGPPASSPTAPTWRAAAPTPTSTPTTRAALIGFEVELMDALAGRLGVEAELSQGQWDQLLNVLAAGNVDAVVNGYELTPARARDYRATRPYYVFQLQLMVREGSADPLLGRPPAAEARRRPVAGRRPRRLGGRDVRAGGARGDGRPSAPTPAPPTRSCRSSAASSTPRSRTCRPPASTARSSRRHRPRRRRRSAAAIT